MTRARAIRLLLPLARAELRRLAVEANLNIRHRASYPAAVGASERRRELRETIRLLEAEAKQKEML